VIDKFKSDGSFYIKGRGTAYTFANKEGFEIRPSTQKRWYKEGVIIDGTHYECKGVEKPCLAFSEKHPCTTSFGILIGGVIK